MPFYLTRDSVPSADMRNVFDNAQNLDLALNDITSSFWSDRLGRSRMSWFGLESAFTVKLSDFESRFSTQIVEQEGIFESSQTDKENRFQQFLLSSGYVFLGDYENGPFQFSARNQYIRYNNQYYRLNAATDVGFTTTGTDATSFVNDVTHFVMMDGDTLRQNLGSGEGQLLIGAPGFIEELRQVELSILDSIKTDGAITPFDGGMADWIFDSSDLSHEVTNYPRLFIAPDRDPSGASGAWRLNVGDIINAVQYGLGLTDDLAYNRDVIQQLAYWNNGKRLIILPPLIIRTLPILIQGVDPKMMGTFGATAGAAGGNGTCLAIYDSDQYTLDEDGNPVYQSFFKVTSSTATGTSRVTGLFLKYIKLVSLDFFADPNRGEFTERSKRTGFELEYSGGQVDIKGLVTFGFERSFIGNELWDGSVINCRVMYGSNPSGTVPAVSIGSTSADNSNNLNVFHFHIEFSPYAIDFGFCEHVHFFGLKVESHRQEDSSHPVVTIRHESAKLNITNSMFVTNPSTLTPFMQDYGRWTRIVNCSFSGGTPNSKDKYSGVRWLDSRNQNSLFEKEYLDVSFDNCLPSDGANGGTDFPVIFGHYSTFKGRASAAASGTTSLGAFNSTNSGLISVGYSCSVDLFYNFNNSPEKTAGSLVYFRNKKSSLLRAVTVEGGTTPYRLIGGDNDNSISTIGAEWGSTASGVVYCYGKKTMYLSASGNYTQLIGVTGQIITVKAVATGCTLINSANLILLGGANLSMVLNKYYTFAIESGTLARQIS
ncbi:hypothetical protein [Klebsiella pneumoniae]|uniref:hypothetical protein n=1 Tax=Klebsiella pneumoniae TaxID=573 RepID=UPI0038520B3F